MKKRLLALMLTGVMVAGAFAGCGDASKAPNAGAGTKTASAEGVDHRGVRTSVQNAFQGRH